MTFGEKISHVAKDDPKFASSVRRIRIASAVFGVAVVVALVFAIWSLAIGFSNKTQITKIESPCLRYGAKSQQCKEAFEQAVLTITHAQACAILRKAGLEIQPCAHARLRQEHRRGKERAATARRHPAGGDAIQPSSKGHQQHSPSPGGGGGSGKGDGKGGGVPSNPGSPGSGQPSGPGNSGGGSPGASGPPASSPPASAGANPQATLPGIVEATGKAAGEVVGQTGGAVQGTVEGADGAGCKLLGKC